MGDFSFRFADPSRRIIRETTAATMSDDSYMPSSTWNPTHQQSGQKRKASPGLGETRRKRLGAGNGGKKEVVQFDLMTNKIINLFASGSRAAQVLGLSQSNVSQCCRGEEEGSEFHHRTVILPELCHSCVIV